MRPGASQSEARRAQLDHALVAGFECAVSDLLEAAAVWELADPGPEKSQ